jgi:hypothetical protein
LGRLRKNADPSKNKALRKLKNFDIGLMARLLLETERSRLPEQGKDNSDIPEFCRLAASLVSRSHQLSVLRTAI